jgi:steroid 5-alpha reductase family enzyme
MVVACRVSFVFENASIVDIVWARGFALVAWVTFCGEPADLRQALLV